MTTTEIDQTPAHIIGNVLLVNDHAKLAQTDVKTNDLTGALYSLNHVAIYVDSATEQIVHEARKNGTTWQMIADALDITKQGAQQKFTPYIERAAAREAQAAQQKHTLTAEDLASATIYQTTTDGGLEPYPTSLV